jgi:uncharacterized protein YbbC (DUF1343 family)
MGELARLVNGEGHLGANLHVIEMQGWTRDQWFDATGLPWVNPSPNIRSLNAALLYPGLALLETSTNYSVGRGTDAPFEQIGADWIRGGELARRLAAAEVPGVRFYPVRFTPSDSVLKGRALEGLRFTVTNRDIFSSARLGIALAEALDALYPGKIRPEGRKLVGNDSVLQSLAGRHDAAAVANAGIAEFLAVDRKYLIYR